MSELRTAIDDFLADRRPIGLQVWRWLALQSWARQYLGRDPRVIERPALLVGEGGIAASAPVTTQTPLPCACAPEAIMNPKESAPPTISVRRVVTVIAASCPPKGIDNSP